MAWHTIRDAAGLLSLSEDATYRLCTLRKLEHRRVGPRGGKIQVSDEAIAAYLRSCVVAVDDPTPAVVPARSTRPPRVRHAAGTLRPDGEPMEFF